LLKRAALFLFIFIQINNLCAQNRVDSAGTADTLAKAINPGDSMSAKPVTRKAVKAVTDSVLVYQTDSLRYSSVKPADFSRLPVGWMEMLNAQPQFNFTGRGMHIRNERYEPRSYDGLFYLLVLLLFYFAVIKLFFAKYLANLLTIFFRASMRHQQLREQVLQSPFPSLLLNNLFVFSGGLYGAFLLQYNNVGNPQSFWMHFGYCALGLTALYLLKFLILRVIGWVFNVSRAVDTYLFVVFMTNKIIGVFLLPILVLISFAGPGLTEVALTVSVIMIGIFYIYRFVASYATLHKEIKISGLHFILYLCALEIAPLLLIYKVLVAYLEKAY
jgi:Domain of unknown function (DUF4271)